MIEESAVPDGHRTSVSPVRGSLRGRSAELERLDELLRLGTGVALTGPIGAGKTRLAEELLALAAARGHPTALARGRASTADLPLGPFAALLSDRAGRASGVALLVAARDAVEALSTPDAPLVLGVDDVHLLDPLSATLVQQLVIDGAVLVVLTAREGEWVPDQVAELWRSERVARWHLDPLEPGDTLALAEEVLGEALPVDLADQMVALTQGNPLFTTALAAAVREQGGAAVRDLARVASAPTLVDFVGGKLHDLEPAERDALAVVALAEPVGLTIAEELADRDTLLALERAGFLVTAESGRRLEVRLAHPLYGEVLRTNLSRLLARSIYRELAAAVQRRGARRRDDLMRVALWSVEGGRPLPGRQLLRASVRAGAAGDFSLAARLARVVWDAEQLPAAGRILLLTEDVARYDQDADAFGRELAAAAAGDEREIVLVAWSRAYDALWRRGDADMADDLLVHAADQVGPGELRDFVASRRAVNLAYCGRGDEALAEVESIDDPTPWVRAGCLYTQLMVAGSTGDPSAVVDELASVVALGELPTDAPGMLSPAILCGAASRALVQTGDVHRAERVARDAVQSASAGLLTGGLPAFFLGWVMIWRGKPAEGYQWCRRAAGLHRSRGLTTLERMTTAGMAMAAAYAGQPAAAEQALRRVDELSPGGVLLYDADVWHARSALAALRGDVARARDIARDGMYQARERGALFDESVACTALLRLGADDDVLGRLDEIGSIIGGLARLFADAASARARGDVASLGEAAERFADRGAATLAAAAASDAARLAERHGDRRGAATWGRRAASLFGALETSGGFLVAVEHELLSRREHEIATLVADGLEPDAVAARLLLPTDVVVAMLEQACIKLGVARTGDLAAALADRR